MPSFKLKSLWLKNSSLKRHESMIYLFLVSSSIAHSTSLNYWVILFMERLFLSSDKRLKLLNTSNLLVTSVFKSSIIVVPLEIEWNSWNYSPISSGTCFRLAHISSSSNELLPISLKNYLSLPFYSWKKLSGEYLRWVYSTFTSSSLVSYFHLSVILVFSSRRTPPSIAETAW